ncbi:MAG: extensin-like domain-containing protein [Paracoccaceae bacterium]
MRSAVLILALAAAPALAQQAPPPETSAQPQLRPERLLDDAADAVVVTDRAPQEAAEEDAIDAPAPPPGTGMRDQLALSDADYAQCLADLDAIGASYAEATPIIPDDDADCGILRPVAVSEAVPGVALTGTPSLRCPTALAAARWARDFVVPAAERLDRGVVTGIQTGAGYVCRRRNGTDDGKPSQHSFGNAIDVFGFTFEDGTSIPVQPREADGTMAEAFQDATRAAACLEFTTVIGPGSNAAHADHLHIDIIERAGGWRLCEQGGTIDDETLD